MVGFGRAQTRLTYKGRENLLMHRFMPPDMLTFLCPEQIHPNLDLLLGVGETLSSPRRLERHRREILASCASCCRLQRALSGLDGINQGWTVELL